MKKKKEQSRYTPMETPGKNGTENTADPAKGREWLKD